jgi:hypothetical protein
MRTKADMEAEIAGSAYSVEQVLPPMVTVSD